MKIKMMDLKPGMVIMREGGRMSLVHEVNHRPDLAGGAILTSDGVSEMKHLTIFGSEAECEIFNQKTEI